MLIIPNQKVYSIIIRIKTRISYGVMPSLTRHQKVYSIKIRIKTRMLLIIFEKF